MTDVLPVSVESLRVTLANSTGYLPSLEAAVAGAQERLRRELAKIENLRALITLYEADEPPSSGEQPPLENDGFTMVSAEAATNTDTGTVGALNDVSITKQDRMERAIAALLWQGAVHRTELLAHLIKAGIMGNESDPLAHLAAFLSKRRDKFTSDGQGHFSLRQSVVSEPPPAPNGAGVAGVKDADYASVRS